MPIILGSRYLPGRWPVARALLPSVACAALTLCAPSVAQALDAEVNATTAAQGYAVRSPFGDPLLYRRRFTQTLGLGLFNLMPNERPGAPQLSVKFRMRFDGDFGVDANETSYARSDVTSRFVPGLSQAPLELMYGYVEGRNLLGGWAGFRLGRQYVVDSLGWWAFDGALVRVTAPYVHVEAYGGFEQRGGLPLSSGRYERSGVWRGDRATSLDSQPDIFPMFQQAKAAPAWGVAIESAGPYWLHGRLDYRKVWNVGEVVTGVFPSANGTLSTLDQTRTSSERVGYSVDGTIGDYGAAKGGVVYDLYNRLFGSYYASLDGFITQRVTASAEYDFYKPTFDGDSIWNWFTHSPITTLTGRVSVNVSDKLDVTGSGGVRWWQTDEDPASPSALTTSSSEGKVSDPEAAESARLADVLASANGRYRWSKGRASLRGVLETGERGRREGVDVSGERDFSGRKYTAMLRGSLYDWRDDLRPDRSATSFGYVVGGAWRPAELAEVMLEWEHNMNRLVGQRYRVLAMVNLTVLP